MTAPLYAPSAVGPAALDELDRVPWQELRHAYGTGPVGPALEDDVAATLRGLGAQEIRDFDEAVFAFFSNLCHQGTIYQATAYATPFLAALFAGLDLTKHRALAVGGMLACVGIAASSEAPHGSHSGSWGPGVAELTRNAIRMSQGRLADL